MVSQISFSLAYGCAVATLRRHAGLSQAALAARSGMTQSQISRLEQGLESALPNVAQAAEMAVALGMTSAELEAIAREAQTEASKVRLPKFAAKAADDAPAWLSFSFGLLSLAISGLIASSGRIARK